MIYIHVLLFRMSFGGRTEVADTTRNRLHLANLTTDQGTWLLSGRPDLWHTLITAAYL